MVTDPARRRFASSLPALGALAVAASHGVSLAQRPPAAAAPDLPAAGTPLKLPEMTLFDGSAFTPGQADGRVLVLYWWASWCPFCAQQTPEMEKLWRSQHSKGLEMLALSIDRKAEDATRYLQKNGYTLPAGLVTPEVARVFPKPKGLPVTVVRGRDGRVLQAEKGQLFPEDVEQLARWL